VRLLFPRQIRGDIMSLIGYIKTNTTLCKSSTDLSILLGILQIMNNKINLKSFDEKVARSRVTQEE
jgi:hypothetical protein